MIGISTEALFEFLFWGLVLATILAPAIVARYLAKRHPAWRRTKVLAISALPLPAFELVLCSAFFARVWNMPEDRCGQDGCPMLLYAVAMLAMIVIICGLAGLLGAYLSKRLSFNSDNFE